MAESTLLGLASIILLGIGAMWVAWRLHLPSILLLLIAGLIVGPILGLLNPGELFGDLLLPIISFSVAIILFEGGLSLSISRLKKTGGVVAKLIAAGTVVTLALSTIAAHYLFGLDIKIALLLGAILVVTGPTVIAPILRQLRPKGEVGTILKWEGIVIDPIGAILAVLIFEAIIASSPQEAAATVAVNLLLTLLAGGLIGGLGALLLFQLLKNYLIPDFLHNAVTLALVIGAFTLSNEIVHDSGLLAVTGMGILLANQKTVSVKHIVEFKENLQVLLISALFIMLAANLNADYLMEILSVESLAFLAVLIIVARPLAVFISSLGSKLSLKERVFLSSFAPRGIVAAAISAVFALRLEEAGFADAELIVPITFMVIAATVAIYGLSVSPLAHRLGIAEPKPQGFIIVGAYKAARNIALSLKEEGYSVLLVDTNWSNISSARMEGLPTFYGNILSQYALDELDLGGKGRILAMTSDNDFNTLVTAEFAHVFGRAETYQLSPRKQADKEKKEVSGLIRGRILFSEDFNYSKLLALTSKGSTVKITAITEDFTFEDFTSRYEGMALPLFLIDQNGMISVATTDSPLKPQVGTKLVSLMTHEKEESPRKQ